MPNFMPAKHIYTAEEIDGMRSSITGLYIYSKETHKHMSLYEIATLSEQMLQTYIAAGITGEKLHQLYYDKLTEDAKKEKDSSDT